MTVILNMNSGFSKKASSSSTVVRSRTPTGRTDSSSACSMPFSPVPYEKICFEEETEASVLGYKQNMKEASTAMQHHDAKNSWNQYASTPPSFSSPHHSLNSTDTNETPVENFYLSRDIINDNPTKFNTFGTSQPADEKGLPRPQEEERGGYRRSIRDIKNTFSKEATQIKNHQSSILKKQKRGGHATRDKDKNSFAHYHTSRSRMRPGTTLDTKKKDKPQKQDLSATMNFPYEEQYTMRNAVSSSPRRTTVLWKEAEQQERLEKHFDVDWQMKFLRSFYSKDQKSEEHENHNDKVNRDQHKKNHEEDFQEIEANESSDSVLENKERNKDEEEDEVEIIGINLPNNHMSLQEYELITKKRLVACIDQTDFSRYQLQEFEMKMNFPREFYLRHFSVEREQKKAKQEKSKKYY